ncbi:MAG TPA: hypothetical protein PK112_08320, partial [candidate division Zixibacteria bacterium]|nr:hypothetical protein [candidate division Zixibacteria bacterium]
MRRFVCLVSAFALLVSAAGTLSAETEQEIVNRYMKKVEKKHVQKIGWVALNYTLNRINRNNDYNSFASSISAQIAEADLPWLGQASTFGVDFAVGVKPRLAWTVGGEYWLKFGSDIAGPLTYSPPSGGATVVDNLTSEIKVYGVTTGLQYFLLNAPAPDRPAAGLSARAFGAVGYYHASWELWPEYQNLNLSTAASESENSTFEGNAPGFTLGLGGEIPLNVLNLSLGADFGYLYLNFTNIAWYNAQDEEIIVTYTGDQDGRVDLDL